MHANGFALMMQDTGKSSTPNIPVRGNGILGLYSLSERPAEVAGRFGILQNVLQSALPVVCTSTSDYAIATTGSFHQLPDGGLVVIAGRPSFRHKDLNETARREGFAAAVARGYVEYSQEIFRLLFGSFCCAIIDSAAKRVIIGIDRLGQETLYYRATDTALHFGSSAGMALVGTEHPPTLLNQGIYNYIYFHMIPCPGSAYSGLKKIPAAHYIEYHNGKCQVVNYWLPAFSDAVNDRSFEQLSQRLMPLLRSSVEKCLPDAGKVGSFLSGGLDSSTVTGVLAELSDHSAPAFSIGFSADGYDEMAYARITARHFGVQLHEYYVTPQDVVDALPMIATSYDEPFGNSSALPAYFCAKMAAENGVATLLAGDGGDEIFGGNERYVKQRVFEHYTKIPGFLRRGLIEPLLSIVPTRLPLVSKANSYVDQANMPLPDRLQSYNFLHRHAAAEIFSDDLLVGVDEALPLDLLRSIYHRPHQASDLNRMLYLDWQITLADNDLRKVSQMCATAGVDVVYPMLDDALVEFSCQVPSHWKIKGVELRYFYKQALKNWLPRETIDKSKQGFGLPFGVWMQTYKPLRELAYDNLLQLKRRGFIRPEFIDRTIKMHQSEHAAYYGELVWIFTVFELWMNGHCGSPDQAFTGR
jgi:asparagine synthase (glutamine-hydrolysing)